MSSNNMLLTMQVTSQGLKDGVADAESGKSSGRFARFDEACLRLSEMSKAGKLPGAFFGRICNVAHGSGAGAAIAVNAVAREAVNLVSISSLQHKEVYRGQMGLSA